MTHQYESEILNKLMERDGFNIPSSVPPYEAEIKAYLINQVKQAYPKLTDYEAEWLLYNYTKHLPADFPVSSVSNVTEASFENVVPFAYQSAILSGKTLVNLLKPINNITIKANGTWITNNPAVINESMIKPSTTYTLITYVHNNTIADGGGYIVGVAGGSQHSFLFTGNQIIPPKQTGVFKQLMTTKSDKTLNHRLQQVMYNTSTEGSITFSQVLLEGDYTTADIPYFEGMQSVKMPVLTTVGDNLCDNNALKLNSNKTRLLTPLVRVKENTVLTISFSSKLQRNTLRYYDSKRNRLNDISSAFPATPINIPNGVSYIEAEFYQKDGSSLEFTDEIVKTSNIMFSLADNKVYEPYKSNILSTSEDVVLRGIGDVQDTLDCLTGQVTERIGEFVLDGSESWEILYHNNTNMKRYSLNGITFPFNNYQEISNHFRTGKSFWNIDETGMYIGTNGKLVITFQSTDNRYNYTINEFKNYLSENLIKLQYSKEESVKTVDLKTVNESGESAHFMPMEGTMHVTSSGETIAPTFDMSVPVEATTQNLASFIDLEMEE